MREIDVRQHNTRHMRLPDRQRREIEIAQVAIQDHQHVEDIPGRIARRAAALSQEQVDYAAADVLYLHELRAQLDKMLEREGRMALARHCFDFIPSRAELDLAGWAETDIFAH